jgi:hypothetical protein
VRQVGYWQEYADFYTYRQQVLTFEVAGVAVNNRVSYLYLEGCGFGSRLQSLTFRKVSQYLREM